MKCEMFYYAICFIVFHLSAVPSPAKPAWTSCPFTEPENPPNDAAVDSESDDYDDVEELPYRIESPTVKKGDLHAYNLGQRHALPTSC